LGDDEKQNINITGLKKTFFWGIEVYWYL